MQKLKKEAKGITLIALVVTIIVLLILAGVAISLTIGNNGLFTRAENAANTWRKAEANEQEEMSNFESLYDETVKNLGLGGGSKKPIGEIKGEEETNTETEDKEGNRVVVPAGFKVVNPESTVNEGIVIEDVKGNNADTVGNQFVWIPCEIETELNKNNGKLKYDRYAFTRETPPWDYNQSFILGENGEYEKDSDESYKIQIKGASVYFHEAMPEEERVSIEKYGGYYIGRYEVGCESERTFNSQSTITEIAKIKSGLNVYNWITRDDAVTIAERMYSGKSRLCSSYAWDTALQFIGGTYAVTSEEDDSETELNTGYHAEKNIYDMGENVAEWTTESCNDANGPCVYRRWRFYLFNSCPSSGRSLLRLYWLCTR